MTTSAEAELQKAVTAGQLADFTDRQWRANRLSGQARPLIRASWVRELVIGPQAPSGVQIKGATIDGDIDLKNARGPAGGGCNTLKLQECDLVGSDPHHGPALDARHGHLSRLSLIDCQVTGIHLSSAVIDGDLILDGLTHRPRPFPEGEPLTEAKTKALARWEGNECWVRARGVRVGGALTSRGSHLQLRRTLPYWMERGESPPTGEALDTVPITVHGLRILADRLDRGEEPLTGNTSITTPMDADDLRTLASWLEQRTEPPTAEALATVPIKALDFRAVAEWLARSAYLDMFPIDALDLQGARISGTLSLRPGFVALGAVNLQGATIGGDFEASGASLGVSIPASVLQDSELRQNIGDDDALRAQSVHIAGRVFLNTEIGHLGKEAKFRARGIVNFGAATIDGPFAVTEALYRRSRKGSPFPFCADNARFGSSLELRNFRGGMSLAGAHIAGDLMINSKSTGIQRIDANRLRVGGKLTLAGAIHGLVDFSGSVVGGDLVLGDDEWLTFDSACGEPELRLTGTSVSGTLRVSPLTTNASGAVDWSTAIVEGLWTAELSCYPARRMGQVHLRPRDGADLAVLNFLYDSAGGEAVVFNGESQRIHAYNDEPGALRLATADDVKAYLSYFCDNIWADRPFTILPDTISVEARSPGNKWRATAQVRQQLGRFRARFEIYTDGLVQMRDDEPLGSLIDEQPLRYAAPFRWVRGAHRRNRSSPATPPTIEGKWTEERAAQRDSIWSAVREKLVEWPPPADGVSGVEALRPHVDLAGLRVGGLIDEDGRNWVEDRRVDGRDQSAIQLNLAGFEYGRIDEHVGAKAARGMRLASRAKWLRAQYEKYPPTRDEYSPQPYQQLAKVLRTTGDYAGADDITFEKLRTERLVLTRTWWLRKAKWLFEVPFGYGLRTGYAVLTFAFVLLVGAAAVQFAAPIVVDAAAVGTVVSSGPGDRLVTIVPVDQVGGVAEVPCEPREGLLYALDVMVPVLDLRQEARCKMSADGSVSAVLWRIGKAGYAVLGWIVTTGLVLTVSGVVRRQVEREPS